MNIIHVDQSKIDIQPVEPHEIDAMVQHRLHYLVELQGERDGEYMNRLKKELADFFSKSIAEGSFFAIAAKTENRVLGYGGMIVKQIPGDLNRSSYVEGEILNMYTLPEARRQGVASLILVRLLQMARARGMSKVALHTSKDGEELYRRFGFSKPAYPFLELLIKSEGNIDSHGKDPSEKS